MINFGAVPIGAVLPIFFNSYDANGASITLTGLAITDIEIYKDTSMTQRASDAGYVLLDTDGIDIDTTTGLHGFSVDTGDNTDAGFFAAGSYYNVVVSAVTVSAQTVTFIAATFRLMEAEVTAGRPLAQTAALSANAITATAIAADAITAAKVADGTIDAATFAAGAIDAAAIATDAIGALELAAGAANEIADALLDRVAGVETGLTPRQLLRLAASVLLGKASGLGTTTAVFRDTGDTKDRVTATVDADGNRSAVTLDAT